MRSESAIALPSSVLRYRKTMRSVRLWLRIHRLASLDVTTEAKAHSREYLFSKGVRLPRAESRVERRGEHIRRNRLLERRLNGPAPPLRDPEQNQKIVQNRRNLKLFSAENRYFPAHRGREK